MKKTLTIAFAALVATSSLASAQVVQMKFTGTEVIIEGTDYPDRISFGMSADRQTVYLAAYTNTGNRYVAGPSVEIPAYQVGGGGTRKIRFNGRNGGDEFQKLVRNVGRFQPVDMRDNYIPGFPPCELFGGDGADVLYGSSHDDLIVGGNGNDNIYCGLGNDVAIGGLGKDNVKGHAGDDAAIGTRTGFGGEPHPDFEILLESNNETAASDMIHGDWDGDGTMDRGYYLRSGYFVMPGAIMGNVTPFGGFAADWPVVGDWEGFGFDRPGIYRPHAAMWHLDVGPPGYDGIDRQEIGLQFGLPFEFPIVGDFHGEKRDRIGVYSAGNFRVDIGQPGFEGLNAHPVEFIGIPFYGAPGDIPVIGDWNGDELDDFGVFRTSDGNRPDAWWILDDVNRGANGEEYAAIQFGLTSDRPIVADYDGDGVSELGVKLHTPGTDAESSKDAPGLIIRD